jgi:Tfp pilus assembly major pilin PilA
MKKILMAAAIIGTVAAVAIVYVQYLAEEKHIEDPTMDIWA